MCSFCYNNSSVYRLDGDINQDQVAVKIELAVISMHNHDE